MSPYEHKHHRHNRRASEPVKHDLLAKLAANISLSSTPTHSSSSSSNATNASNAASASNAGGGNFSNRTGNRKANGNANGKAGQSAEFSSREPGPRVDVQVVMHYKLW